MTAISFLLLGSGLAMCGWRFVAAFQAKRDDLAKNDIGKLISSLFFLSAGYNVILGISSLLLTQSPNGLFIIQSLAHITLTALAFVSVYALYYIFWPTVSPKISLITIGLMGAFGFIPSPAITFSLLTISLLATLYIFIQLFRKTETRNIKILSIAFSALTLASVAHALIQLIASTQQIISLPFSAIEITLGLIGATFLLWSITTPAIRGAVAIFIGLIVWWLMISGQSRTGNVVNFSDTNVIWSFAFQIIALWGVWWGFKLAHSNSGFKTAMSRAINLFTIGLLCQILAHNIYFIYIFLFHKETPYPGLADVGYIGSIIIYIVAVIQLGYALGINYALKLTRGKIWASLLFSVLFVFGIFVLLQNYTFDWTQPIKILLDFGYPLIESIYLGVCLLVYLSVDNIQYKGIKNKILLIFTALGMQYLADTLYTYFAGINSWSDGSVSDLSYLGAYFLMTIAIIQLSSNPTGTKTVKEKISLESAIYITRAPSPKRNYGLIGAVSIFSIFLGWWATLYFGLHWKVEQIGVSLWTDLYSLIIILGVWFGFRAVHRTGGFKNTFGKAIGFFTFGLLLQIIAGIIYGFYVNYLNIPIPYPSLADIGWFGSIIFYAVGAYYLCKTLGIKDLILTNRKKLLALIPAIGALILYWAIVSNAGYVFNWQEPVKTLLDIAYPIIGAIYLSFGILAWRATKKNISILPRVQVLGVIVALIVQYLSDTNFIYQTTKGTWIDGSYGDLLLLSAYFAMTIAIIKLGSTVTATTPASIFASDIKIITNSYAGTLRLLSTIRVDTKIQSPKIEPQVFLPH